MGLVAVFWMGPTNTLLQEGFRGGSGVPRKKYGRDTVTLP